MRDKVDENLNKCVIFISISSHTSQREDVYLNFQLTTCPFPDAELRLILDVETRDIASLKIFTEIAGWQIPLNTNP
ncbi:hypothetical protein [Nostoc sp. CENA543]|uniref:hypothetical protein n=1 Tax=Nostoc sp. CENA543 TaxID=1869241 RepID=UPI001CEF63DA|nr:hypothetical protein [Nostoc sp. CENA543]